MQKGDTKAAIKSLEDASDGSYLNPDEVIGYSTVRQLLESKHPEGDCVYVEASSIFAGSEILVSHLGAEVLGCPIGNDDYERKWVEHKVDKWIKMINNGEDTRPIKISSPLVMNYERALTELLYERNRGTIDAVRASQEFITRDHASVILMSLDVPAAFDSLSHDSVRKTLLRGKVSESLVTRILAALISRRNLFFGENDNLMFMGEGIPQGSPLSSVLYMIVIRNIFENLGLGSRLLDTFYADDINISFKIRNQTKSVNFNSHRMQTAKKDRGYHVRLIFLQEYSREISCESYDLFTNRLSPKYDMAKAKELAKKEIKTLIRAI
ncbi:hypothetical protein GJ496_002088 [Pomphorhynchus laevis]|nr:hypothetical protein GJ496_002088 [Pomphorhynchus laevis]